MRFTKVTLAVTAGLALGVAPALGQEPDGKALYEANCVRCHGADGTTPTVLASRFKNMRSLNDPSVYVGVADDSIAALLDNGIGVMKPYKGKLDHDQELAIAAYIRTLAKAESGGAAKPEKPSATF